MNTQTEVLIVLGIGKDKKPRAATFETKDAATVEAGAAHMSFKIAWAKTPEALRRAQANPSGKQHFNNLGNNRRDEPTSRSFACPDALSCCSHQIGNSAAEQQKQDHTNHQEMPDAEAKHETALFLECQTTSQPQLLLKP